ncbi:MAG: hypothetical protein K0R17_2646 [Rariglobus sp.]|jgi:hypothetical protein|nr:hypothetical protein [Rariglobus sp.]
MAWRIFARIGTPGPPVTTPHHTPEPPPLMMLFLRVATANRNRGRKPPVPTTGKIVRLLPTLGLLAAFIGSAVPGLCAGLKLLTVGNSFADNSVEYLPGFAQSAGHQLRIYRANLGAHSLQMHVGYLRAFEADPADPRGRPYQGVADPKTGARPKLSLRQALELDDWDYVTVQQLSALSFQPHTYEPWAGELIAYIRRHAPKAKILGLQTWAYREDSWLFKNTTTQERMHLGIKKAYAQLAATHGIQILPVGDAFQIARATPRWTFTYPDPQFNNATAKPPALPVQPGSLNVGWKWEKDAKTGGQKLTNDAAHCNGAGQYLAAAVLYEALFSQVEKNTYHPPKLAAEDAASLRRIAHQAVSANPLASPPTAPATSK